MAQEPAFKPLKEFGSIALSDTSELKFYVDEYRGRRYGSIRTFVKGDAYSGPTKSGITLSTDAVKKAVETLSRLPEAPPSAEKELWRLPKRAGITLVARLVVYKNEPSVDLREWVEDETYKGWSRKGTRIPYAQVKAALGYLQGMSATLSQNAA